MLTAMRGHVDAVEKLLENDVPVHPSNWDYCTDCKTFATIHGHFEVVVALLSAGAETRLQKFRRNDVLEYSRKYGQYRHSYALLARGALERTNLSI